MGNKLNSASNAILNGGMILDIRTPEEFCSNHLRGAINIPTPLPPLDRTDIYTLYCRLSDISQQNPKRTFIVYCKKGIRSKMAAYLLKDMGGHKVIDLGGVMEKPLNDILTKKVFNNVLVFIKCSITGRKISKHIENTI